MQTQAIHADHPARRHSLDELMRYDKPTIDIDYDRPDNPWWMRHIHDELRELEPGLFLGLDLWRTQNRSIGLVWFALSALGTVSL